MKLLTYTPLTSWQVAVFRSFLPHIVEWLRMREEQARFEGGKHMQPRRESLRPLRSNPLADARLQERRAA